MFCEEIITNRTSGTTSLALLILVITMYGVTVLEGMTQPAFGLTSSNTEVDRHLPLSFYHKSMGLFEETRSLTRARIDVLIGVNETTFTSRLEASLTSMMDTLEKIQRIVNELRMLVETLHQMTQTFIAVVNELSLWFDRATIDASVSSSV